jgi:hypothetical protein
MIKKGQRGEAEGPAQGWDALVPRLLVRLVEGASHDSLLRFPFIVQTAKHIADFLEG